MLSNDGCLGPLAGSNEPNKHQQRYQRARRRYSALLRVVAKEVSAVGFGPTRLKTLRPERNPLDNSGNLTGLPLSKPHITKIRLLRIFLHSFTTTSQLNYYFYFSINYLYWV